VIHTLRKLAREIHGRSVWQVLGVYLLLAWLVHAGVWWATRLVGLPLWTPDLAFVLLAIGLPVVIATAIVQGGIPWLRIVDVADPNVLEGRTPDEVHVVPSAHAPFGTRLFTWRNAILGGVMAAVLLVASVVAYSTIWALGIGPVGSLLAQEVISEGDVILVADFESRVEDAAFASMVAGALREGLSRSPVVTVLDAEGVSDVLSRAAYGRNTPLDSRLALELAMLAGFKVIVDGGVTRSSRSYRVHARIVLADGTPLARFEEVISDDEGHEEKVAILVTKIRERFGESLRSIRADLP
jgi:hypothetical protein